MLRKHRGSRQNAVQSSSALFIFLDSGHDVRWLRSLCCDGWDSRFMLCSGSMRRRRSYISTTSEPNRWISRVIFIVEGGGIPKRLRYESYWTNTVFWFLSCRGTGCLFYHAHHLSSFTWIFTQRQFVHKVGWQKSWDCLNSISPCTSKYFLSSWVCHQ